MQAELQGASRTAAARTVEWIAAHYKAPYLLQLAGRPREARQLLDLIAARFQQPSGDFLSRPDLRTADPVLAGYPAYMSGWIAMAAHKIGRFDLSLPAWGVLQRF